jgi:hypothetical protein
MNSFVGLLRTFLKTNIKMISTLTPEGIGQITIKELSEILLNYK